MKAIQRIIISLGTVAFAVCCGAMLLFNWHALGFKTLDLPTGSMRPTIPPGSLVLMHSVPISTIKVGDVITYTNPRYLRETITHRVIKTYTIAGKVPAFITKGDANPKPDSPVASGLIKGKAIWHIPYVGRWMQWSKTWAGLATLVYLPALLLMIEEVQRLSNYLRSMQPYQMRGFRRIEKSPGLPKYAATASGLAISFVIIGAFMWQPALALLHSNTVSLINNRLSVAKKPVGNCNNENNINVSNSSTQTATSGQSTVSGNTNGGNASSGNASSSNSTNVNINIQNNC